MTRFDVIVPRVLEVGGNVVLGKAKDNLQAVIGEDTKYPSRSTGELISSLGHRFGDYEVNLSGKGTCNHLFESLAVIQNRITSGTLQVIAL